MRGMDLRDEVKRELRRHPRVMHQKLFEDPAVIERLAATLPAFVPFRNGAYAAALWVIDWDHRLPSRELVLRLYAFYTDEAKRNGVRSWDERLAQIGREDLFPEFDVPDFGGLLADEAYESEMSLTGEPKKFRLVSDWRRDVESRLGRKAEEIARASSAFKELSSQVRAR